MPTNEEVFEDAKRDAEREALAETARRALDKLPEKLERLQGFLDYAKRELEDGNDALDKVRGFIDDIEISIRLILKGDSE